MKELSIEEKARRYDKALKVLHKYDGANIMFSQSLKEEMFPELKELEDEKIRKWIIGVLSTYEHDKYLRDAAIAWLERQGEHVNFLNKIQIGDKVTRNQDGVLVNLSQLNRVAKKDEKQGEQKIDPDTLIQQRVDALADIVEEQKPAELPKGEDYGIDGLYHAIRILEETIGSVDGYQSDDGILEHKCAISAVKQLAKQNNAWSEEDEKEIAVLEAYIRSRDWSERHIDRALSIVDELVKKLKSLRPQSRWKPDSSMLICLEYAIKHINKDGDKRILSKLLEQLKKLREE